MKSNVVFFLIGVFLTVLIIACKDRLADFNKTKQAVYKMLEKLPNSRLYATETDEEAATELTYKSHRNWTCKRLKSEYSDESKDNAATLNEMGCIAGTLEMVLNTENRLLACCAIPE